MGRVYPNRKIWGECVQITVEAGKSVSRLSMRKGGACSNNPKGLEEYIQKRKKLGGLHPVILRERVKLIRITQETGWRY
jgi:hypothetical protein